MEKIIKKRFGKDNCNWDENRDFTKLFLYSQKELLNKWLPIQGCVLLAEVYDNLGFPRTKESCYLGWVNGIDKEIRMGYQESLENPKEFELAFKCRSVLDYLESEDLAD